MHEPIVEKSIATRLLDGEEVPARVSVLPYLADDKHFSPQGHAALSTALQAYLATVT